MSLLYPKPKCGGNHSTGATLIEVYAVRDEYGLNPSGEERSVKWCQECGAVVVDKEFDGRFAGSVVPMKFPKVLTQGIPIPKTPSPLLPHVHDLTEGMVKKGGVNLKPTTSRPPAPQAQGVRIVESRSEGPKETWPSYSITREIHEHFLH